MSMFAFWIAFICMALSVACALISLGILIEALTERIRFKWMIKHRGLQVNAEDGKLDP